MIFFIGNDGTIVKSFPSPVYQGSVNANNIYVIAPFAENLTVTVAFRLPNGIITERFVMTPVSEIAGVTDEKTGKVYSGWQFSMPNTLTKYFGTVKAQFFFYSAQGVVVASASTDFQVGRGVPDILPDEPSADVYAAILSNIASLQQQLNNGAYSARAIYAWNSAYSYGANEITYYPDVGLFGALVKSKTTNNLNNPPYNAAGELNSQYWETLLYFTSEGKAAIFWGFNQSADLSDLEKAVAFEPIAIDEENVVLPYKEGYYIVATKPFSDGENSYPVGVYVDMLGRRTQLTMKGEPGEGIDGNGSYPNMTVGTAIKAINDELGNNISNQFGIVTSDIEGLREDILNESHFRGMFVSVEALREAYPTATPNDFAWIVGGNIWIYTSEGWIDSGDPTPANAASLSNTIPLMDGAGAAGTATEASRADHRHPSDTSKADLTALNAEAAARQNEDNKNSYNLGAFDSYVYNGDGTGTVAVGTEIERFDGSEDWNYQEAYNGRFYLNLKQECKASIITQTKQFVKINQSLNLGTYQEDNSLYVASKIVYIRYDSANGNISEFKDWLSKNPLVIEYASINSYSYKVIDAQPIRPANQEECDYWHKERQKGLNLIDLSTVQSITKDGVTFTVNNDGSIKINGTNSLTNSIIFSLFTDLNKVKGKTIILSGKLSDNIFVEGYYEDKNGSSAGHYFNGSGQADGTQPIYIPMDAQSIFVYCGVKSGATANNATLYPMLNEGNHAYPFEPYHGGILREKDLENLKSPLFYGLSSDFRENEFGHGLSNNFFNNQFNRMPVIGEEFFATGKIYDLNNGVTTIINSFLATYKITSIDTYQSTAKLIDYTFTRGEQGKPGERGEPGTPGASYTLNGTVLTITFNTD